MDGAASNEQAIAQQKDNKMNDQLSERRTELRRRQLVARQEMAKRSQAGMTDMDLIGIAEAEAMAAQGGKIDMNAAEKARLRAELRRRQAQDQKPQTNLRE